MTEKRFGYRYNEESAMIQIIDNYKDEPNANSICNVKGIVDLLNEQDAEIKQLKEFKNKVFKGINTELSYLTEKAMDNPVNHGRIKALEELKRYVDD